MLCAFFYGMPHEVELDGKEKENVLTDTLRYTPADTLRNNDVVITSKRRHFDVIMSKSRRFDVITTSLLRNMFSRTAHV